MGSIILSAIMCSTIFLLHCYWKCKQKAFVYILLFFAFLGAEFFIDKLYAENDLKAYMMAQEYYFSKDNAKKSKKTKREIYEECRLECESKREYHREQAYACYDDFEKICNKFPNLESRDRAMLCLKAAFGAAIPGEPAYKIIGAALLMLEQISSEIMDQWQQLDTKLHQAQMHAEMYDHFWHMEKHIKQLRDLEPKASSKLIITD